MAPLGGEYGFLTDFSDSVSEETARARVRTLMEDYSIREFQFYNAFEGFSRPPGKHLERWHCIFSEQVSRAVLTAYIQEIANLGGRSWLFLQMMGVDAGDSANLRGIESLGQKMVNSKPIFDIVVPTSTWADMIAPDWADYAASLGFSGIHWSTLGDIDGMVDAGVDIAGFLRTSKKHLEARGLDQTANFVNGFGWESSLYAGPGEAANVVAFPYWALWDLPEAEDRFRDELPKGSVQAWFPGVHSSHEDEPWNRRDKGVDPLDLLIRRWKRARCRGDAYLAVGDGGAMAQVDYLPDSRRLGEVEAGEVRQKVFWELACHGEGGPASVRPLPSTSAKPADEGAEVRKLESPPTLLLGFNCSSGGPSQWSEGKRRSCCGRRQIGCPASRQDAEASVGEGGSAADDASAAATTSVLGEQEFDCGGALTTWEAGWWCCEHKGVGCETNRQKKPEPDSVTEPSRASSSESASPTRPSWTGTGTTTTTSTSTSTTATTSTSSTTTATRTRTLTTTGTRTRTVTTTSVTTTTLTTTTATTTKTTTSFTTTSRTTTTQTATATSTATSSTSTVTTTTRTTTTRTTTTRTTTTVTRTTTSTTITSTSTTFDCSEEFNNWPMAWSLDKKKWCCGAFHRGCDSSAPEARELYRTRRPPSGGVPLRQLTDGAADGGRLGQIHYFDDFEVSSHPVATARTSPWRAAASSCALAVALSAVAMAACRAARGRRAPSEAGSPHLAGHDLASMRLLVDHSQLESGIQ